MHYEGRPPMRSSTIKILIMNSYVSVLLAFLVCVLLLNCKKDSEMTMTELVIGTWQITELKEDLNDDGDFNEEYEDQTNSCEGDNIFIFESNGDLTINQELLCFNQTDPQNLAKWAVSENDSLIIVTIESDIDTMTIANISESQMILHEMDGERIELIVVLGK